MSVRPETLSVTDQAPSVGAYETSDMRFPPALYLRKRIAPPSRVIRQVRLLSPEAVKVETILTPPSIGSTASVSPPRSEQTTVRTLFDVVSATCASARGRSAKDDGCGVKTASRSNQRKPETLPAEGVPSATRKRMEPTEGPSNMSQSPAAHVPQPEQPSSERKSERPPVGAYFACSHALDHTSASPRNTFATARPSTTETVLVISG